MTMPADPVEDLWTSVLGLLAEDDRITPQLQGFLNLVEPKGVLAGTLYLEVPNDLTRGMLEQRIRIPLTEAIARIGECRTLQDLAAMQSELLRDNINRAIEGSRKAAEIYVKTSAEAAERVTMQRAA